MTEAPPGFSVEPLASPDGIRLKRQLQRIASRLLPDDFDAERSLPRLAIIDILNRAVCSTVKADARQASVLKELLSHPKEHWIPLPLDEKACWG